MTTVAVGPFDVVDSTPAELDVVQEAFTRVTELDLTALLPRHKLLFKIDMPKRSDGGPAQGYYPGNKRIWLYPVQRRNGKLRVELLIGNLLHEAAHGLDAFVIGQSKEQPIIKLFDPVPPSWLKAPPNIPPRLRYWAKPYEYFCDILVRAVTGNKVKSAYEDDRPYNFDYARLAELVSIIKAAPPVNEPPPIPGPTEPEAPESPEIAELRLKAARLDEIVALAKRPVGIGGGG